MSESVMWSRNIKQVIVIEGFDLIRRYEYIIISSQL